MEKNNKSLWLTLILIFIGMFLLASVFASGENKEKSLQTTPTLVSNVYKNYENNNVVYISPTQRKIYDYSVFNDKPIYAYKNRYYSYKKQPVNRIQYTQHSTEETRKSFLGDCVKEYSVYVTNRGETGKYYTVVFELEDKNGYEFTQSITQYLRTGESKKFVYKDIQYERNEILNWNYRIIQRNY